MRLKRRRLSEGLAASLAAVGPRTLVAPHVGDQRGLVTEAVGANVARERSLAGMSRQVVPQVDPRLELLPALEAVEVPDVVVLGSDVSLEPARFAETLVAVLAPDLPTDAVGSEVVPERVPVSVAFVANVALGRLALVGVFVHPGRRPVVEPRRAPVAKVAADKVVVVVAVRRVARLFNVRRHGVPGDVEPEVPRQVLTV